MKYILICLVMAQCAISGAAAQDGKPPDLSPLKYTATSRVAQIIDGLTILMKDGKIVRLSSLDIPADENISLGAKTLLEKELPAGTEVLLYQTRKADVGRVNRMNHHLAHMVRKSDQLWVNGLLLKSGLARAMPTDSNADRTAEMLAAETDARTLSAGLWKTFPVLTADTAESGIGGFHVVEGTVKNAASVKNNLYVNFGGDWKKDFTVMIPPAVRKSLLRQNINPMDMTGQKIRVRGDIRSYNGPFIELQNAHQIEVMAP